MRALATRSAIRGSSRNSTQRPSGRSVMASRPSSSACHVSSGVFMSPGNRVARPTIAMSSTSRVRDQSSSSSTSTSGSPSTMTVASDSMVGCRNATVAVSVTPVRSSMSLAIATASRDDRPSSTIGVDSSIASGDWPVALADPVAQPLAHLGDGHVGACGRGRALGCQLEAFAVRLGWCVLRIRFCFRHFQV